MSRFTGFFITLLFANLLMAHSLTVEDEIRVRLKKQNRILQLVSKQLVISDRLQNLVRFSLETDQLVTIQRVFANQISKEKSSIWKITWIKNGDPVIRYSTAKQISINGKARILKNELLPLKTDLVAVGQGMDVIGSIPLEEYLVGVLAGEMPAQWPMESLKAQAIAARSYALSVMQSRVRQNFHVENTVMDQVYKIGFKPQQSWIKAVQETEGLVLTESSDVSGGPRRIVKSYFHADCGGQAADAERVWSLQSRRVEFKSHSFCQKSNSNKWKLQISKLDLEQKLNKLTRQKNIKLQSISVPEKESPGRVYSLLIHWQNKKTTPILAQDLRQALGFDHLKSTFFSVTQNSDQITFIGKGYGHGVGLCQWGAKEMALAGRHFVQILAHYYPQASVSSRNIHEQVKPTVPRLVLSKQKARL